MEIIMNLTMFYFAYEVMKVIMPHVESSWRMVAWNARQLKEIKKETITIGGESDQVNVQILGPNAEKPEMPVGYGLYAVINLVYSVYLIAMFFTFNPVCMLCSIGIKIWGKFISKFEPLKRWVMLDGAVSAVILFAALYITRFVM